MNDNALTKTLARLKRLHGIEVAKEEVHILYEYTEVIFNKNGGSTRKKYYAILIGQHGVFLTERPKMKPIPPKISKLDSEDWYWALEFEVRSKELDIRVGWAVMLGGPCDPPRKLIESYMKNLGMPLEWYRR